MRHAVFTRVRCKIAVMGLLALLATLGAAQSVRAESGDLVEVFIDARQPAYVIYQGIAEGTSQLALDEMAGYATLAGMSLVPWAEFRANPEAYISAVVVKNEYPGGRTAVGILAMLKAHPGRPIAITWNGGIATSFFDFQHAVEMYEDYRENAERYESSRAQNAENDPLSPEVQIKAMLGG